MAKLLGPGYRAEGVEKQSLESWRVVKVDTGVEGPPTLPILGMWMGLEGSVTFEALCKALPCDAMGAVEVAKVGQCGRYGGYCGCEEVMQAPGRAWNLRMMTDVIT